MRLLLRNAPVLLGWLVIVSAALALVPFPPKTSAVISLSNYSYATQPPFSGWSDRRLQRRFSESDREFSVRLNNEVFQSIYHCHHQNASRFIDRLMSWVQYPKFQQVGMLTPSAMRCGLCHQSAYVLARALTNGGLNAKVWALNGHVVTLVDFEADSWILDPDYGLGPIRYNDALIERVRPLYDGRLGANAIHANMRGIETAYRSLADDQSYYTMDWLNNVEGEQYSFLLWAERLTYFLVFTGGTLVLVGLSRLIRT